MTISTILWQNVRQGGQIGVCGLIHCDRILYSLQINSQYSVASVVESMLPVYRYLLTKGLKIWIYRYYILTISSNLLEHSFSMHCVGFRRKDGDDGGLCCSGDIDGVVPTTGTRYWLRQLDLIVEVPWYPWNHSTQVCYDPLLVLRNNYLKELFWVEFNLYCAFHEKRLFEDYPWQSWWRKP